MRGWQNSLSARTARLAFKWRMRRAFRSQTGRAYFSSTPHPQSLSPVEAERATTAADRAGDVNAEPAASKLPAVASPTAAAISSPPQL